jgi:virulence factor Mce-like protein
LVAFSGGLPFLGGSGGRTVVARFAQANEIDASTPVRVGGVDVGHVRSLKAAPGNTTDVALAVDAGVPLHADASAEIRWRTLLGGSMYIDLHPGSPSAAPLEGVIPLSRTGSQVDWDQFNSQLSTSARPQLRRMFRGFAAALRDPAPVGRTLTVLGPTLRTIGRGSDALRGREIGDLTRVVKNTAAIVRALGTDTNSLAGLVDGGERTLGVTAAHNAALAQAIQLSPPALDATLATNRVLGQTLTSLDLLIPRLEPGARLLGPTTAVLRPLLGETERTLVHARPLLRRAPPLLRGLGAASEEGVPLLAGLTPIVQRLNTNLIPFLKVTDPDTRLKLYETFGPFASALGSAFSGYAANGYVYNFNVQLDTGSVVLPCDTGPNGVSNLQRCIVPAPANAFRNRKR